MPPPSDPERVVAAALSWLGTPYHDQASVRGVGCDCLGLARGVWREVVGPEPITPPPYTRDWGEVGARETFAETVRPIMIEIDPGAAGPGALVLFRMRAGAPAKHCGILIGRRTHFVHAYERAGVVAVPYDRAWARRAAFAFLYPAK
ncbi:MAG TPA: peptidase [Paracoccaceae bacterium]|nr:peptidase [Paracoccaceae bacterium]